MGIREAMGKLLCAAPLAALALGACGSTGGGAGPTDAPLPATQRADGLAVVCIVDARSGRPIEGATFAAIPESDTPLPATWWQARASESDADGIARLALADLAEVPWLLFRAEGYAPRMELTRDPGPRVALEPAFDLEVEVRDAFERPVADAFVSWYAGCGHTPDLSHSRTDADGRARLEGIALDPSAGDLWIAAPGIDCNASHGYEAGLALLRVQPGTAARGRVVDADGQPLAGAFVGSGSRHHGPWSRTASDGTFELPGLRPPLGVRVLREADESSLLGHFDLPRDGRPVTLTVAPPESGPTTAVEVRLRTKESLEPLTGLEVEFVRLADGFTVRRHSDEEGVVALELSHGAWERRIGGGLSGWAPSERRVMLADELFVETLSLEAQPRWRVRLAETHAAARVELVTERALRELSAAELAGEPVRMPREGRCALRVTLHDRVRVTALDSVARREGGELALELPVPLEVRAQLVGPDGAPARGVLWVGDDDPPAVPESLAEPSENPSVRTWHAAPAHLWVLPEDPALAPRRLARVLPWEELELDLGTVALEAVGARRVTLQGSDGAPLAGAEVHQFGRLGRHAAELRADGSFESAAFPAESGDALVVRVPGSPTFHATLAGPGPWTVTRPDTRVAFEVVGEDGRPLERFDVVVEGEVFSGAAGRLELSGLDPGPHAAFVSADGRTAWRQPFDLVRGASIQTRITLGAR
jgi:hypothetical protein